jgi:DNA-binding SARP family transcriptional activator
MHSPKRRPTLLEVMLFGNPHLRFDGLELLLPTRKSLALVTYLALEGMPKRSTLADLLWGELGEDDARKNLRQELHRLSKTGASTDWVRHNKS